MVKNERVTEDIVRDHFKKDPLYSIIKYEEQKSSNRRINEILQKASKSGGKGIGRPEFIISFPMQNSNFLIIIECKADSAKHESKKLDSPKDYAVDGVLHYSKLLNKEFDIIAIAVSGQEKKGLSVSNFLLKKGSINPKPIKADVLLSIHNYIKYFENESFSENLKNIDIIQKAVFLNEEFHSYSVTENGRCTIVSAILLGLLDNTFKQSYSTYHTSQDLASGLVEALKRVLRINKIRNRDSMLGEFLKILNEPLFKQTKIKKDSEERLTIEVTKEIVNFIYSNVYPLMRIDDTGTDVLGKFYTEFIRYAGSSQKQGLVLTPFHVTDFFCDLADISKDSIVYDPCCGSGGFLISAMKRMLSMAGANEDARE